MNSQLKSNLFHMFCSTKKKIKCKKNSGNKRLAHKLDWPFCIEHICLENKEILSQKQLYWFPIGIPK